MHIIDSAQRERVAKPTSFGMNPAVAERLRALGVDPEERARGILAAGGTRRTRRAGRGAASAAAFAALARGDARQAAGFAQMSLDPSDVRVTPLLNQAALMVESNEYIADAVAPAQLAGQRSAKYKIWDRGPYRRPLDSRIGPSGSAKEVSPTLSEDNYSVKDRALKAFTENDTELANPSLNARAATVEQVMEQHLLKREIDVATLFNDTTQYPSASVRALGGTAKWNGGSTADPISDILYALEQLFGDPTDCVFTDIVWHAAQQNAQLKAIVASRVMTNQGLLAPSDFQLYFGIPNLWITRAYYFDDSNVRHRIWSEANIWLGRVVPGQDQRTFCRTFRLRQGAGGYVTKTWRDEDRGINGGDYTRVAFSEDRKIVSSDYGVIITGAKQ